MNKQTQVGKNGKRETPSPQPTRNSLRVLRKIDRLVRKTHELKGAYHRLRGEKTETVRVRVPMPGSLQRAIRRRAKSENLTVSQLAERAITTQLPLVEKALDARDAKAKKTAQQQALLRGIKPRWLTQLDYILRHGNEHELKQLSAGIDLIRALPLKNATPTQIDECQVKLDALLAGVRRRVVPVITGPISWSVPEYERAEAAGRFVRTDLTRSQIKHSQDEHGCVKFENFLLVATAAQLDALRGTVPLFWTHKELEKAARSGDVQLTSLRGRLSKGSPRLARFKRARKVLAWELGRRAAGGREAGVLPDQAS